MSDRWRLLKLDVFDAYTNMAIDESIMRARKEGLVPNTLRLYRWNPSAVSIGYFQSMTLEVDLDAAKRLGIDVIRRITGGGAVYHDYNGEITYSLIVPVGEANIPIRVIDSYKKICNGLVLGLKKLGIQAEFKPINDIIVNGMKISGSAQTRKYNVILQHGTLLVDVDVDKMFTVLKVPNEKIRDKIISSVKERVTSIRHVTQESYDFDYIAQKLVDGFSEALNVDFEVGELTEFEKSLVPTLRKRYMSKEWLFLR